MKKIIHLSLKFRLTLQFAFIFTALLVIFSYVLYLERSNEKLKEFDASLYNYSIDIAESLDIDSFGEVEFDSNIYKINEKIFPFSLGKSYITVLDINGKILAHSHNFDNNLNISITDDQIDLVLKQGASFSTQISTIGIKFRVINYLLPVIKKDSPLILHISVPLIAVEQSNSSLKKVLIFSLIIILILSIIVGFIFISRALNPIIEITDKTKLIEVKNLKEKVPTPKIHDEIFDLATTINHLLERINTAFENQERFIQDASHQLKTPLAIIKGELDLIKSSDKSPGEIKDFLNNVSSEIESLIKLTNNLLILARIDSIENKVNFEKFSIQEILMNQVSRLSKLANSKNINLFIDLDFINLYNEEELTVFAEPELLGILFYNLIENAIKYSPDNSKVSIFTEVKNAEVIVKVVDEGLGVKAGQEEKIFERFFRSQKSDLVEGSGLGLAICHSIAKIHNAVIWSTRNEKQGSTFYLKIRSGAP